MEVGKCKIKPNAINELKNRLGFGRGKRFNYKHISPYKAMVYNKGNQFIVTIEELYKYFEF